MRGAGLDPDPDPDSDNEWVKGDLEIEEEEHR